MAKAGDGWLGREMGGQVGRKMSTVSREMGGQTREIGGLEGDWWLSREMNG